MQCPRCGAQLPEGASFCGSCGAQFNQQSPRPVSNNASKMIPITFLLTIALVVISILLPLTTSILDIPVVEMALSASGASTADMKSDMNALEKEYNKAEERFEEFEDQLSSKGSKAVKQIMKATKKTIKTPSLLNTKKLIKVIDKTADKLDKDQDIVDTKNLTSGLDDIQSIMNTVIGIIIGMFVLPAIFTLLGGLLKSKGLTITALVFMVISQILLCGFLWVVLSLVVYILQAVLCHKAKHG